MNQKLSPASLLLLPVLAHASIANTTDPLTINPYSPWYALNLDSGWHFDTGLGIEYEPTYAGADQYDTEGDVFARALYRSDGGHRYYISLGEAGALFSLSPSTQLQVFLEYEEERNSEDDMALEGMDIIDSTIEGQATLAHRFDNLTVFVTLQPDLKGDADKGLVWFVGAGYDAMLNEQWRISTRLDISGADNEHMRTEFGITNEEAQRTGYTTYTPNSGLKSLSLGLNTEYFFNDRVSLFANIETEYYFSEASNSPLIDQGGRNTTIEANVGLRWRF